MNKIPAWAFQ